MWVCYSKWKTGSSSIRDCGYFPSAQGMRSLTCFTVWHMGTSQQSSTINSPKINTLGFRVACLSVLFVGYLVREGACQLNGCRVPLFPVERLSSFSCLQSLGVSENLESKNGFQQITVGDRYRFAAVPSLRSAAPKLGVGCLAIYIAFSLKTKSQWKGNLNEIY